MVKPEDLEQLYRATEEDLLYGIGVVAAPGCRAVPFIQCCYRQWTQEKLELVREAFQAGLFVTVGRPTGGTCDVYINTRALVTVEARQAGDTSVLRAPAWDAHLVGVDERVIRGFRVGRLKHGGFVLILQAAEWEFITTVDDGHDRTAVGPVTARSHPLPPEHVTA